jgi:hypothetical protein
VPWRYKIVYTVCSTIVLPKALQNILSKLNSGAIEFAELSQSGATESVELFQEGRYRNCTDITQEWRYRNYRTVLGVVLRNMQSYFRGSATESAEFFAKGATELATKCTTKWRYELALAVKGSNS